VKEPIEGHKKFQAETRLPVMPHVAELQRDLPHQVASRQRCVAPQRQAEAELMRISDIKPFSPSTQVVGAAAQKSGGTSAVPLS
jgi:hypothetical protein